MRTSQRLSKENIFQNTKYVREAQSSCLCVLHSTTQQTTLAAQCSCTTLHNKGLGPCHTQNRNNAQ